jgi:hypothetical protein
MGSGHMNGMTLDAVALLGRATKQAVAKAESPKRWLEYRMRQVLAPAWRPRSPYAQAKVREHALAQAKDLLAQILPDLRVLSRMTPDVKRGRGRPRKTTLEGFCAFLGVRGAPTFEKAFGMYLRGVLNRLTEHLQMCGGVLKTIQDLTDTLGFWLPATPRDGCRPVT